MLFFSLPPHLLLRFDNTREDLFLPDAANLISDSFAANSVFFESFYPPRRRRRRQITGNLRPFDDGTFVTRRTWRSYVSFHLVAIASRSAQRSGIYCPDRWDVPRLGHALTYIYCRNLVIVVDFRLIFAFRCRSFFGLLPGATIRTLELLRPIRRTLFFAADNRFIIYRSVPSRFDFGEKCVRRFRPVPTRALLI